MTTIRMHCHDDPTSGRRSDRHGPLVVRRVQRVAKDGRCLFERDTVLAKIRARLSCIPAKYEGHAASHVGNEPLSMRHMSIVPLGRVACELTAPR